MKITIEISENEVKAFKAYLSQFNDDGQKVTAAQIKEEIKGIVNSAMQSGSLGDYYKQYCTQ